MKKKIKFYKELIIEVIETLCTICLCLSNSCYINRRYSNACMSHFYKLKDFSTELRGESEIKWEPKV